MEILDRITIDPQICNGKPVIRSHRLSARTILEFLGRGESREEILRQFPFLKDENIDVCARFAARLLDRGLHPQSAA